MHPSVLQTNSKLEKSDKSIVHAHLVLDILKLLPADHLLCRKWSEATWSCINNFAWNVFKPWYYNMQFDFIPLIVSITHKPIEIFLKTHFDKINQASIFSSYLLRIYTWRFKINEKNFHVEEWEHSFISKCNRKIENESHE
jgi:hypothetical protein